MTDVLPRYHHLDSREFSVGTAGHCHRSRPQPVELLVVPDDLPCSLTAASYFRVLAPILRVIRHYHSHIPSIQPTLIALVRFPPVVFHSLGIIHRYDIPPSSYSTSLPCPAKPVLRCIPPILGSCGDHNIPRGVQMRSLYKCIPAKRY